MFSLLVKKLKTKTYLFFDEKLNKKTLKTQGI